MADEAPKAVGTTAASPYSIWDLPDLPKAAAARLQELWKSASLQLAAEQQRALATAESIKKKIPAQVADVPVVRNAIEFVSDQAAIGNAPADNGKEGKTLGADPVDLASGQLLYQFTDLRIDGAGVVFELTRTYRSQARYPNGPLGAAWDHSYNLWLRVQDDRTVYLSTGALREDRFVLVTPRIGATDPETYFAPPDGIQAVVLQTATGFVLRRPGLVEQYYEPAERAGLYRIAELRDGFGNLLKFVYDADRTTIFVNHPSRWVTLDRDSVGRISQVLDHTGREVRYYYDDFDDLCAVDLPASHSTPNGRSMFYEYSSGRGPTSHQLTSVRDCDGRRYLDVEYGRSAEYQSFDRVVRQRDDNGEWLLDYARLLPEGSLAFPAIEDSEILSNAEQYTQVTKPTGTVMEHWFNRSGNELQRSERGSDGKGRIRALVWRTLHNADGVRVAHLSAEGQLTQYWTGREEFLHRLGRDPFSALSDDVLPGWRERLLFGFCRGQVRRAKGTWPPLQHANEIEEADVAIRYLYDPRHQKLTHESDPRITTTFDEAVTLRGETLSYRDDGALVSRARPEATSPDGTPVPAAVTVFDVDSRGRLKLVTDASGALVRNEYFASGDARNGYLQSTTEGDGSPVSGTTTFDRTSRGNASAAVDPDGRRTERDYGDFDELIEARRFLKTLTYRTRFRYSAEGRQLAMEQDWFDDLGTKIGEGIVGRYSRYDDSGQLIREATGSSDTRTWLMTRHRYDGEGRRIRTATPEHRIAAFRFDSRGNLTVVRRGGASGEVAVQETRYDGDGRMVFTLDERGVKQTRAYDSLGRLERVIALVTADDGHTRCFSYDKADRVVLERLFEFRESGYFLLERRQYIYDERGRRIRELADWFAEPASAATLDDFQEVAPPGASQVESTWYYDQRDLVIEHRFAGSRTTFEYDERQRLRSEVEWNGDEVIRRVDQLLSPGGPVLARTETSWTEDGEPHAVTTTYEHDELGRVTAVVNGMGGRTETRYDSLDRSFKVTNGEGNVVDYEYDVHGRMTKKTEHVDGTNSIATQYIYDGDGHLIRLERAGSTLRTQVFDAAGRRKSLALAPGFLRRRTTRYSYDASSRLTRIEKLAAGSDEAVHETELCSYDEHGILSRRQILVVGRDPYEETFVHDGSGRLVVALNVDATVRRKYDSLGYLRSEETAGQLVVALPEALGPLKAITYPGGRVVSYTRDTAGRIRSIADGDGPWIIERFWQGRLRRTERFGNGCVANFEYDLAGRRSETSLADSDGTSLFAETQSYDGAGRRSEADQTYDGLSRLTNFAEKSYAYDATSNRVDVGLCNEIGERAGIDYDELGRPKNWNGLSLGYDALGRLTRASDSSRFFESRYDALGRRLWKQDGDLRIEYTHWLNVPIVETDSLGNVREHILDQQLDRRVGYVESGSRTWWLQDAVGSPRVVASIDGAAVERRDFGGYGEAEPIGRDGFMGRPYDRILGLYEFRTRHYDAVSGSFLQPDRDDAIAEHSTYEAFLSSPLTTVDPFGTRPRRLEDWSGEAGRLFGAEIATSVSSPLDGDTKTKARGLIRSLRLMGLPVTFMEEALSTHSLSTNDNDEGSTNNYYNTINVPRVAFEQSALPPPSRSSDPRQIPTVAEEFAHAYMGNHSKEWAETVERAKLYYAANNARDKSGHAIHNLDRLVQEAIGEYVSDRFDNYLMLISSSAISARERNEKGVLRFGKAFDDRQTKVTFGYSEEFGLGQRHTTMPMPRWLANAVDEIILEGKIPTKAIHSPIYRELLDVARGK